jgi:dipeptidyl aminopeptidase/acylaminoacyl peptidase
MCAWALIAVVGGLASCAEVAPQASPQRRPAGGTGGPRVFKDRVTPHWFANNTRFWYRNELRGGAREFILVDAERGSRTPAFDHARLAAALAKVAGGDPRADRLPFDSIEFTEDTKAVRFSTSGKEWRCDLTSYEVRAEHRDAAAAAKPSTPGLQPASPVGTGQRRSNQGSRDSERSPDGKWSAFLKDSNVFLRGEDGKEVQLSSDGKEGLAYGRLSWSRDSLTLVAFRIEPGDRKEVYLVQSSPPNGGRAQLQTRSYDLPGDKFAAYELNLFDVANQKQLKPDVERIDFGTPRLQWRRDGRSFLYQKVDRGHQRLRLIEVNTQTGASRNIIDEKSDTFIWTAHADAVGTPPISWLEKSEEVIHASEKTGWRHLYLVDAREGKIKNAITSGDWVVRVVDRVDEEARQIWFRASGVFPGQDPYLAHFGRVNFDGTGLVWLTAGDGNHDVQYSPDRKFIVDTYSRVDLAPVNELRRVADGKLVCALETADISGLRATGWASPEVFSAKGRDGKTDIWGIICRPRDFDPKKKYPIIEDIYAGPHGSFVPKTFSTGPRYESLNRAGFVVVKIDGMGTANRSKAFHDVCWHNLKDAGFEDRILWMKAAAAKYPYLDVTRVGIYGTSAGGQNAAAAVLFHPEFYKAAVANCGCHDNRMDKASWNEQWMGYRPANQLWNQDPDNWYAQSSNIDNAHRLQGKLFLILGELDTNVPPESTYRFVDALVKAGKDFDFLLVPNGGHGAGGAYAARRREDFFVRHLMGKEPPNRNAKSGQ